MFPQTQRKRKTIFSNTNSNGKRKRHQNKEMIVEDTLLPLRILSCEEGNPTHLGTGTLHFSFQHLDSKEKFNSTVFENNAPTYMDSRIIDAVLPPDVEEYLLEDLVNKGLFAKLKFRTKNDKTYINIVQVAPLNDEYQNQLEDLLLEEQQNLNQAVKNMKNQMKDINLKSESSKEESNEELDENNLEDEDLNLDENDLEDEELNLDEYDLEDEDIKLD